jgi:hypothetical protein
VIIVMIVAVSGLVAWGFLLLAMVIWSPNGRARRRRRITIRVTSAPRGVVRNDTGRPTS